MDDAFRETFIQAWRQHDEVALRVSESRRRPTAETLRPETNKLVDLSIEYVEKVGLTLPQFSDLRQCLRRAGLNYEACLQTIEYGVALRGR